MKLEPLGDRLIVEIITDPEHTKSGLWTPPNKDFETRIARVLSQGDEVTRDLEGENVLISQYDGIELTQLALRDQVIIRESNVIAIIYDTEDVELEYEDFDNFEEFVDWEETEHESNGE